MHNFASKLNPPIFYDFCTACESPPWCAGRLGGVGGRGGVEPGSFGYMLEKEMRFDEDFAGGSSSSSHLPLRGIPPMALHHHRDPHLPK